MKTICIGTNDDLEKEYLRLTGVIIFIEQDKKEELINLKHGLQVEKYGISAWKYFL
jgi:hypothetical protein